MVSEDVLSTLIYLGISSLVGIGISTAVHLRRSKTATEEIGEFIQKINYNSGHESVKPNLAEWNRDTEKDLESFKKTFDKKDKAIGGAAAGLGVASFFFPPLGIPALGLTIVEIIKKWNDAKASDKVAEKWRTLEEQLDKTSGVEKPPKLRTGKEKKKSWKDKLNPFKWFSK